MRESDLYEASYGSNAGKFNDGKVKYIPEKKMFTLVSEVSDGLYLVAMLYTDGRILVSTTKSKDVFSIIVGSIEQLLNPIQVADAYEYRSQMEKMVSTLIEKFYTRLDEIKFVSVDNTDLKRLKRFLQMPEMAHFLEVKRYEYVEEMKTQGVYLITYQKQ